MLVDPVKAPYGNLEKEPLKELLTPKTLKCFCHGLCLEHERKKARSFVTLSSVGFRNIPEPTKTLLFWCVPMNSLLGS